MEKINLKGKWSLYLHAEDRNMPLTIEEVKEKGWSKIEASVPGNVEIDLCNAGIEKDPFLGENIYNYRKYEFYQWWFEREFEVPQGFKGKRIELVLHGLDTYGTVWINGIQVGETDNMLIEHSIDISNSVRVGETNHIAIRIKSAINMVREREFPVNIIGNSHKDEMVWIRKPPHCFGWDIMPRLLSAGIWRDIEIVAKENTFIKEVYYATRWLKDEKASLTVKYRFTTDELYIDDFSVRVKGECGENTLWKETKTGFCSDELEIIVQDPKLWWPKAYGEQNLYKMTFELLYKGEVVDTRTERIGIREVNVVTRYAQGDEGEFKIIVNGCPIMAKGSNWVPLDALHSRDKERLKAAHDLLEDSGCNIVRCWGGNVYEDHEFYDLCDERGMMVWQDFAMACAILPQNDEFAKIIEKEAASVIKKLRNHTSIILWAGDNEIDGMYFWNHYHLDTARYNRVTRETLPRAVGTHDPFRKFIPSSPYIPEDMAGDLNVPEQHNWGPRDYFKGEFYKNTTAHFISEIGYHGCPAVSSLKKFISTDKLWPYNNDEWDTHNTDYIRNSKRNYNRNELMANQVEILFGYEPDNIEEFALASQISQAEAKKFFIEMVRLKKWRRTGVIWWNMLDGWPQISDAVVDYYLVKKIAYYYIKRVQKPVCIMMDELCNWEYKVILGNDSCRDAFVKYTVEDGDTGKVLLEGEKLSKANENIELGALRSLAGQKKLYLMKWEIDGMKYGNHYISGYVPMNFKTYRDWLDKIKALPVPFDPGESYK